MSLGWIDYTILALYFSFVLAIGFSIRRRVTTSEDFLTSRHSVPLWITSLAFLAANLGAQEVVGMCASGAKYGLMTAHFYWLGAVPAMLFVGIFMMPFYYGSRARSVRISQASLRRKDASPKRRILRRDDPVLLRCLH